MVNEKKSTKSAILEILRNNEDPVTGHFIAEETGVSRVAIWKAIQSLEQSGYKISSSRAGYLLENDVKDGLFPWEFGNDEECYSHFLETDSTMNRARALSSECKTGEMKIVTADIQTAGQGHKNHKWTTTKGSLACTFITKEFLPVAESHRLVMACQIALIKSLQKYSDKKIFLRWPNDIWSEDGKIGGVLDDLSATGSFINWENIGFGLNLSSKPKLKNTDCIFKNESSVSRKDLLKEIVEEFKNQKKIALESNNELEQEWNLFCPDINKKFKLKDSDKNIIFKGINSYGWAKTETAGEEKLFPPCTINFQKNGDN